LLYTTIKKLQMSDPYASRFVLIPKNEHALIDLTFFLFLGKYPSPRKIVVEANKKEWRKKGDKKWRKQKEQ